jgi:crotonobetainyl-CoA:carnitine CoA-transferase CaiB-like acyl-CoA transferase
MPLLEKGDMICGYVNSYKDMFERPSSLKEQIETMEMVVERPHHYVGKVKMVGVPVKLSETPGEVAGPEPPLGHHTEEILLELGYTWDDIVKLREEKVI